MPPFNSSSDPGLSVDAEYNREELEEFLEDHPFDADTVEHYRKVKRISSLFGRLAIIGGILTVLSIIALIVIPAYSLTAELVLHYLELPHMLNKYIAGSPAIQTSTLIIVTIIGGIGAVVGYVSSKLSNKFEEHGNNTEISETEVKHRIIAQSYREFDNGEYSKGFEYLEKYDGFHDYIVDNYSTAIQQNGTLDEEYIEDTYEDFFRLFVERITAPFNTLDPLREITRRSTSKYYVQEQKEMESAEHTDSYLRIVMNGISGAITDFISRISSAVSSHPMIPHGIFLIVGIGLINIDSTLAVVVVTVLTAGFESWRRNRIPDKDSTQSQNEKIE